MDISEDPQKHDWCEFAATEKKQSQKDLSKSGFVYEIEDNVHCLLFQLSPLSCSRQTSQIAQFCQQHMLRVYSHVDHRIPLTHEPSETT